MGSSAWSITFNFIATSHKLGEPWMPTHWLLELCIIYVQSEIFSLKSEEINEHRNVRKKSIEYDALYYF